MRPREVVQTNGLVHGHAERCLRRRRLPLFALSNLWMARGKLLDARAWVRPVHA
ncbi:MAG: hypothetical protein ACRYGA_00120 [Janthinobacterium lividum]